MRRIAFDNRFGLLSRSRGLELGRPLRQFFDVCAAASTRQQIGDVF
jgi:hypothetical protein